MPRARFTVEEVQAAALRIVDRDGVSALSMRSLAAALGTGPMTIYNYVRDRDELEGLLAGAVVAQIELPESSSDWADDVRAVATAVRNGVRAHPNAVPLILARRSVSTTGFCAAERLIEALDRAGLSDADLVVAFRAVLSLIAGSIHVEHPDKGAPERIRQLAGDHPRLAALAEASDGPDDFDGALDLLLAGIAARR